VSDKKKHKQDTPAEETEIVPEGLEAVEAAEPDAADDDAGQKYAELNDRYLRLLAEYENYRKRSSKEKIDIYPQATASAVEKFLPVLDNLERASGFERTTEDFAKGFDMICQSFAQVLQALGVEAVGEEGEPFNPDLHNAVMHIEDEALGDNVVSQVMQKGYRIGDRIIRYAMVQTAN
jgi:molecular chaperone GrpE